MKKFVAGLAALIGLNFFNVNANSFEGVIGKSRPASSEAASFVQPFLKSSSPIGAPFEKGIRFVLHDDLLLMSGNANAFSDSNYELEQFGAFIDSLFFTYGKTFFALESIQSQPNPNARNYLDNFKVNFVDIYTMKEKAQGFFNWNRTINGKMQPFIRVYSQIAPLSFVSQAIDSWKVKDLKYEFVNTPKKADIIIFNDGRLISYARKAIGLTVPFMVCNADSVTCNMKMELDFNWGYLSRNKTTEELQAVMRHELGHALGGFGHSEDVKDLMYAQFTKTLVEVDKGTFQFVSPVQSQIDLETMANLYSITPAIPALAANVL